MNRVLALHRTPRVYLPRCHELLTELMQTPFRALRVGLSIYAFVPNPDLFHWEHIIQAVDEPEDLRIHRKLALNERGRVLSVWEPSPVAARSCKNLRRPLGEQCAGPSSAPDCRHGQSLAERSAWQQERLSESLEVWMHNLFNYT